MRLAVIVFSIFSSLIGNSVFASSCEKEIQQRVKAIEARDVNGNHVDILLVDINKDGRDEIMYSEQCSANGCFPETSLLFFTEICQVKGDWLQRWTNVSNFDEVEFDTDDQYSYITGINEIYDFGVTELNKAYVTYKFDGKSVEYSSTRKADLLKSVREITSTEVAQKAEIVCKESIECMNSQTIAMEYDLNGDGKLESISCGYWPRWGVLSGCKISSQNSDNSLLAVENLNPKRFGVLPDKYNGWHVLVDDYTNLLIYEREVGYVEFEIESQFEMSDNIDFFGDDLTSMGHKDISLQECQLICLGNEECSAYSYIKHQKWCFPKKGTGTMKVNSKVSSGYKININCEKDATVMAEVRECAQNHHLKKIELLELNVSNALVKVNEPDAVEWLKISQQKWFESAAEFCSIISRSAYQSLGLYAYDASHNCFAKLIEKRASELEELLFAVSKNDFDHYLN